MRTRLVTATLLSLVLCASVATAVARPRAQGPASVDSEIHRLLEAAAGHASWSAKCADGSGTIVSADAIVVTPPTAPSGDTFDVAVAYTVNTRPESGLVGRLPGQREANNPSTAEHATFTFERHDATYLLKTPDAVPGISMRTPLERPHNGKCISSRAWRPRPIKIGL